jgi:hypothetical protein
MASDKAYLTFPVDVVQNEVLPKIRGNKEHHVLEEK